jgi:hypothetical protein
MSGQGALTRKTFLQVGHRIDSDVASVAAVPPSPLAAGGAAGGSELAAGGAASAAAIESLGEGAATSSAGEAACSMVEQESMDLGASAPGEGQSGAFSRFLHMGQPTTFGQGA